MLLALFFNMVSLKEMSADIFESRSIRHMYYGSLLRDDFSVIINVLYFFTLLLGDKLKSRKNIKNK